MLTVNPPPPSRRPAENPTFADFLTRRTEAAADAAEGDSPVKVQVHRPPAHATHKPHLAPGALLLVQVLPPSSSSSSATSMARRTVTHLVPPWHRDSRPPAHGIAGNAALGLALFGLTTGLLCRQAFACEDDPNVALSGTALGVLAGVLGAGALECLGRRPLERPMFHLHRSLHHLGSALWRPSVAEQLRAIVADARVSTLNTDGLDAVLASCERAMDGIPPEQRAREALPEIVGSLVPQATGAYSGPKADLVRSRVQAMTPGGRTVLR